LVKEILHLSEKSQSKCKRHQPISATEKTWEVLQNRIIETNIKYSTFS